MDSPLPVDDVQQELGIESSPKLGTIEQDLKWIMTFPWIARFLQSNFSASSYRTNDHVIQSTAPLSCSIPTHENHEADAFFFASFRSAICNFVSDVPKNRSSLRGSVGLGASTPDSPSLCWLPGKDGPAGP